MAIPVSLNGAPYSIPEVGDANWAASLTLYLQALATAFPQTTSGASGSGCYVEAINCATAFPSSATPSAPAWTNEITDTDNAFTPATSTFVVPANKSGQYLVTAKLRFNTLTANTGQFLSDWNVAAAIVDQLVYGTGFNATDQGFYHVAVLNLTAGQSVQWQFSHTNTASRTPIVSATDNRLTIKRLV